MATLLSITEYESVPPSASKLIIHREGQPTAEVVDVYQFDKENISRVGDTYATYNTAPTGDWLTCDGSSVLVDDYPELSTFFDVEQDVTFNINSWTVTQGDAALPRLGCCYSSELGIFVTVQNSNAISNIISYSSDGINWQHTNAPVGHYWTDVEWSPELSKFVAVSTDNSTNAVMYSSDGITWYQGTSPSSSGFRRVVWGANAGKFVAVSSNNINNKRAMYSSDGITWTLATTPSNVDHQWHSVCWSKELGLFCAVGKSSTGATNSVMTSTNGISWTLRTTPITEDYWWYGVVWAKELGLFVAVSGTGTNKQVMTSPNGTSWTLRTTPTSNIRWYRIDWAPEVGYLVAVTYTTTTVAVMVSQNGIDWSLVNVPENFDFRDICWAPDILTFLVVGYQGKFLTNTGSGDSPYFTLPNISNTYIKTAD